MKSVLAAALLALALSGTAQAEPLPGASVESLLAIAREGSPDLRMVRLEAEAARERIGPAGALPDPRSACRTGKHHAQRHAERDAVAVAGRRYQIHCLLQPLPFWGKRDLKREIAAAEADQAAAGPPTPGPRSPPASRAYMRNTG